jgi:hypothetical protein
MLAQQQGVGPLCATFFYLRAALWRKGTGGEVCSSRFYLTPQHMAGDIIPSLTGPLTHSC